MTFSALPGGYRVYNGSFSYVGSNGFWWSATDIGSVGANGPYLAYSLDYLESGNYYKCTGNAVRLVKDSATLAAPLLTAPANAASDVALTPTLTWNTVNNATAYRIQLSTVSTFKTTIADDAALTAGTKTLSTALSSNTTYYWRVNAKNAGTTSAWSTGSFTTVFVGAVSLTSGWNLVSLNVAPLDSGAAAVFGSMSHLVIAKNCAGQVFWPAFGVNTIGIVHTGQGYQVYTTGADTIRVAGAPVNVALTPIALDTGWNMMAYLPQTNMPITTVLAGILLQITIVKDNLGGIFWPDFGINTIGAMQAGQGYYIHMKSAASLTCPFRYGQDSGTRLTG